LFVELDKDIIDDKSNIDRIFEDQELQDVCKNIIYDPKLDISETAMLELKFNGFYK
jgi:hypothetical protein